MQVGGSLLAINADQRLFSIKPESSSAHAVFGGKRVLYGNADLKRVLDISF